jgi:hypothetical protein
VRPRSVADALRCVFFGESGAIVLLVRSADQS